MNMKFSEMTRNDGVDVSLDSDQNPATPNQVFHGTFVMFGYGGRLAFIILDEKTGSYGWFNENQVSNIRHNDTTDLSLQLGINDLINTQLALLEAFKEKYM
jgi:hypothetical protein